MKDLPDYIASLDDLTVIEVAGADAATFLHGQLTHDVTGLSPDQARLAGYCTAKGRLLGTLVFWRSDDGPDPVIHALVKADVAESLIKRLSMFVLRAKAKLSVTTLQVTGMVISTATAPGSSAAEQTSALPENPAPWSLVRADAATYIAAPTANASQSRWWVVSPDAMDKASDADSSSANSAAGTLATLGAPLPVGSPDHTNYNAEWQSADIAAGLPWVVAATQDVFIPQTLNLDLIDGVSFTKGCYPGQEVVARSHYRGTVKRRMAYGVIDAVPQQAPFELPGLDIFNAKQPNNPCGRVINAAHTHQTHILMEVQLADLDTADFRLGNTDGPVITLHKLPYDLVSKPE